MIMSTEPQHIERKPATVWNIADFRSWLMFARPGERCHYHQGWLMEDRQRDLEIDSLATEVWQAYEDGKVILCQQRVPGVRRRFIYIAIKRRTE